MGFLDDFYKCLQYQISLKYIQWEQRQCRGAYKSLARPTSPCILFDGKNISFDASLAIYINSSVMNVRLDTNYLFIY